MFVKSECKMVVVITILSSLAAQLVIEVNGQLLFPSEGLGFYEGPGINPNQIIKARGYRADDYFIRSQDGYQLKVTRGMSPFFSNSTSKGAILFVHGLFGSYNNFVINSFNIAPTNLTQDCDLTQMSEADANAKYGSMPSAKSLQFLAMDCGYITYTLSRRGYYGSQQRTGDPLSGVTNDGSSPLAHGPISAFFAALLNVGASTSLAPFSFDANFWNFSYDEQAMYDFPLSVDFVRNQTGQDKIAVVSHSAGGAVTLMSLTLFPELNAKLSAVILWSPAFTLGAAPIVQVLQPFLIVLQSYIGSIIPVFLVNIIQATLGLLCGTPGAPTTICEPLTDIIFGASGELAPIRPEFISAFLLPTSTHDPAQLLQAVQQPNGMIERYSSSLAIVPNPAVQTYNLSKITNTKISFYVGLTDGLVAPADVKSTMSGLTVPSKYTLIDTFFNHVGYFAQFNNSQLVIVPSLRDIQILSQTN